MIAPMPGQIIALLVATGAHVAKGTPLLILEAMKMESVISAPIAGVVERLGGPEVGSVEPGDLIMVIKP